MVCTPPSVLGGVRKNSEKYGGGGHEITDLLGGVAVEGAGCIRRGGSEKKGKGKRKKEEKRRKGRKKKKEKGKRKKKKEIKDKWVKNYVLI